MRAKRIHLRRAPGLPRGLELERLSPALNLVLGPNASGKTTLSRAVRATLWKEEDLAGGEIEVEWECAGALLVARRAGLHPPSWSEQGAPRGAPALPPARLRSAFFLDLQDLLAGRDESEAEIAARVRRELGGGYELGREKLLADWRGLTPNALKKRAEEARAASVQLQRVRAAHEKLGADEARLAELGRESAAARSASRELDALSRARAHRAATLALAEAQAECARFPAGMERVPEDLQARVHKLDAALREAEEQRSLAQSELAAHERELGALRSVAALGTALLSCEERKRALLELLPKLDAAELRAAELRGSLSAGAPELARPNAPASPEGLERSERCTLRWSEAAQRLRALEAELEQLGEDARAPLPEQLERAAERLAAWLDARAARRASDARLPYWIAGGAALLAGAVAWLGAPIAGLGALGVGLVLLVLGARARRGVEAPPPSLADLGLAEVEDASALAVARRLQEFGRERARAERARRRAELSRLLERAAEELREAAAQRDAELARLGLGPGLGELPAQVLAQRLVRAERGAEEARAAEAALAQIRAQLERELAAARSSIASAGRRAPADAREAIAALDALAKDRDRLEELRRARPALEQRLERAELARRARAQERDELFRSLDLAPGDLEGLHARAARVGEWKAAARRREEAELRLASEARALAGRQELLGLDEAELERLEERARALAAREEELVREEARIQSELERARAGNDLARALAAVQAGEEALLESRRELLRGRLAEFLVADVEREHKKSARPELVRRAAEHFARATRARYELELAEGAPSDLPLAVREDGRSIALDALSAGTRAQLGVALRLAVVESAESSEGGERLPLFLDEVLANSDPERFAALVALFAELAREGRQVFYLTADPDELQRLCEELEALGESAPVIHRVAELAPRRAPLQAGPRTERIVPPPGALSAEQYFELLRAPPFSPRDPIEAQHLAHFCFDDLEALHRMLVLGFETVGRTQRALEQGWTSAWSEPERARLALRARAAEVFAQAWLIGRGTPLDEEGLRSSPAVTRTYADALVAIAREVDWDAGRFLEILEARDREELKGFRSAKEEELRNELTLSGHHDPRERLDEPTCLDRVAAALESDLRSGTLTFADLRTCVAHWWRTAH